MRTLVTSLAVTGLLTALAAPAVAQDDEPWMLYLNRCAGGCTLSPGANNAREFQTELLGTPGPTVLSEFSRGDAVWDGVVECMQQVYAPYNVQVVDVEPPASSKYHMAVVAGTSAEAGLPPDVGGVGFVRCDALTNQISLTFDIWGNDVNKICATIAQESAHTFGLGHAFHCSDPMTYLPLCGRAFFRDENFQCGEFSAGAPQCRCSGPSQNSHRWLLGKLGESPTPVPGPNVTIQNLTDGQTVDSEFRVTVLADHERGVDRVEFWVNGTQKTVVDGPELGETKNPWVWVTPANLADGYIDLEIKAYNDIESETISAITVLKGEPCATDDQCTEGPGQFCEEGRCKFPIATGELGDSCTVGTDCKSGLCPLEGDTGFCSQDCDPASVLDECGDGFECRAAGASGFCWPEGGGGCGCTTGSDDAPLGGILLTLGLVIALGRRRRKQ